MAEKEKKKTPQSELDEWHDSVLYKESKKWVIDQLEDVETKNPNDIEKLIEFLLHSDYFDAPCSGKFHLNKYGGLLIHSIRVAKQFIIVSDEMGFPIHYDSALICGLLHDLCKVRLYKRRTNSNGTVSDSYGGWERLDDDDYGHGDKSVDIILEELGPKFLTKEEKYIIRWHMYNFDKNFYEHQDFIGKHPMIRVFHACDLIATSKDEMWGLEDPKI